MWFQALTGFREETPEQVRSLLRHEDDHITSTVNGKSYSCGRLETPTLAELRERLAAAGSSAGQLRLSEVVGAVQLLHCDPRNAGALFQVASQFNLLEMVSPSVTPERGVGIYENDRTQGPACAIAAGAGTIYRNYFARVGDQIGQTAKRQLDCLADLGDALGNDDDRLWAMRNGYAFATEDGLIEIRDRLLSIDEDQRDALRQTLRIGLQWDPQVTLGGASHLVSQAYCSAVPVAYSAYSSELWEEFASLVLEAAYEATLIAGVLNAARGESNRVFLTLLGGRAFGNQEEWICSAIRRAVKRVENYELDVAIVSYGGSRQVVRQLIDSLGLSSG